MNLESFRSVRWIRTINLVLQAILIITFVAGLNYLAPYYNCRWDLTRDHRQSLSQETISYISNLKQGISIIVTIDESYRDPEVAKDINGLLREYVFASSANSAEARIKLEYIDTIQQPKLAEQRGAREPNAIIFLCEGRKRVITPAELYKLKAGERTDFLGEQVFTAAMLDVSSVDKKKIYFLTGHGELQLNDTSLSRGLSVLRDQLLLRNFALATLSPQELTRTRKIPDDAALVIIAGADRIEPATQEMLQQYLRNRDGNALIFLTPRSKPGLFNLLYDWGMVFPGTDILVDNDPAYLTDDGNLRINGFNPDHKITQTLVESQQPLIMGLAASLEVLPKAVSGVNGVTCTPIAGTNSKTAYASKGEGPNAQPPKPSAVKENHHINVAIAAERIQSRGSLTFSVRGGRLVVFGSSDMVSNRFLEAIPGNLIAVLNSINWTTDRDAQLTIQPKPIEKYQLELSQEQLSQLRLSLLYITPGVVAILGLIVYWSRRS